MKVLMVCLGNICRSPLAHGVLRSKAIKENLDIEVDSAGTSNYHVGSKPDARMIATAEEFNIGIDDLRARQFEVQDFDNFDVIYAMDSSNFANMKSLARNANDEAKLKLFLNESHPGMNLDVPDPYYGGEQGFAEVYELVDVATDHIIEEFKKYE